MKPSEIRKLTAAEIEQKISEARHELMNIRFQTMTGQVTDTSQVRIIRREIARMETIVREKKMAETAEESKA
jgi:large subunit ribosomal protein L29